MLLFFCSLVMVAWRDTLPKGVRMFFFLVSSAFLHAFLGGGPLRIWRLLAFSPIVKTFVNTRVVLFFYTRSWTLKPAWVALFSFISRQCLWYQNRIERYHAYYFLYYLLRFAVTSLSAPVIPGRVAPSRFSPFFVWFYGHSTQLYVWRLTQGYVNQRTDVGLSLLKIFLKFHWLATQRSLVVHPRVLAFSLSPLNSQKRFSCEREL